jgi:hypothetical protein
MSMSKFIYCINHSLSLKNVRLIAYQEEVTKIQAK